MKAYDGDSVGVVGTSARVRARSEREDRALRKGVSEYEFSDDGVSYSRSRRR